MTSKRALLPYPLRRSAMHEMLHGGVRVRELVMRPPIIQTHDSTKLTVPRPNEEREDWQITYSHTSGRMIPLNMSHHIRRQCALIRDKDVYSRFIEAKQQKFHPRPSELSILPQTPSSEANARSSAAAVFGVTRYMPFQILKPMAMYYSVAGRSTGLRGPSQPLHQELLDGKGFGWKKKSRSLWQQDIDTKGFQPDRFY